MPPKNVKKKNANKKVGKKEEPTPESVEQPPAIISEDSLVVEDLDLINDINEDFFNRADKVIQNLAVAGRNSEAAKIRKYVNIVHSLHRKYVDEVKVTSELRPEIERADYKLRVALELTTTSQEAMEGLKDALSEAWKEADTSQIREQDIQEQMQELVIKCESFESKQSAKQDDSSEFGNLAKYKNIILRERDRLNGEVVDLEKRLQFNRFYSESLEYVNRNNEDTINKQSVRIKSLELEKQRLDVKIRSVQSNLEDQKETNARTQAKLDHCSRELNETHNKLLKKIADFERQKLILERFKSENLTISRNLTKTEEELTELKKHSKEDDEIIRSLRLEDRVKGNIILQLTKKYKKAVQDHSSVSSKLYTLNRAKHALNEEIIRYKNQINALEKDVLSWTQKHDEQRRLRDNMARDRDSLRSDMLKLNNQIADLRHSIMVQNNTTDNLQLDIAKLNGKLDEVRIAKAKTEKERDEMSQDVEVLHERIETYQEQMRHKTEQVTDLTEKLTQKQHALINIKKQLEVVHSDKMMLQRSLEICTQERDNFRLLQMKTSHQTAQLTNEIAGNQNKINSLNLQIDRMNNEKKELKMEVHNKENMMSLLRKDLKELVAKNGSLMKVIDDDERKFMKITHDLDETRKEKNLIGLQMVRRNDEIIILKEKLSLMQTAMDQGQSQYHLRVEDIRLLKVEIKNLETERTILTRAIKSTADMREEIVRLQRLLIQERVRVRSLTEDSKTPTGVHRWRILKGEDPNKFQLLAKVQMLQRRNLRQEVEKTNLERKLTEATKVSASLKKIVENLPPSDLKQRLVTTLRINRTQRKKLKAISAELAIGEIELRARECIIEEFRTTLKLTKQQIPQDAPTPSSSDMTAFDTCFCTENCVEFIMTSDPSQEVINNKENIQN